ncbi:MAG: SHOCT domain-containing protein [Thermaceae bacterium]|nr:SHOCT domain-containing protein [Thermaceae bacterium]
MDIAMAHFGMGYGMGFNPFLAFFGFIFNLLFFVLFIAGIFWLLRMFRRGGWGRHGWRGMRYAGGPWGGRGNWLRGSDDAVDLARERFAKGEISKEQYDTLKAGLEAEQAKEEDWRPPFMRRDDALELARMRFAKGEITQEQYDEIKKGLN